MFKHSEFNFNWELGRLSAKITGSQFEGCLCCVLYLLVTRPVSVSSLLISVTPFLLTRPGPRPATPQCYVQSCVNSDPD